MPGLGSRSGKAVPPWTRVDRVPTALLYTLLLSAGLHFRCFSPELDGAPGEEAIELVEVVRVFLERLEIDRAGVERVDLQVEKDVRIERLHDRRGLGRLRARRRGSGAERHRPVRRRAIARVRGHARLRGR